VAEPGIRKIAGWEWSGRGMLCVVRRTGDRSRRWGTPRPVRRAARLAAMDGNPLRRGIDRVERALGVLLALAFLVAVPVLVPLAGSLTWSANTKLVHQEQSWREVRVRLLGSAPARAPGFGAPALIWIAGRWQAPSGARRTGLIPVAPGTPAGSSITVWVNRHGTISSFPPLSARAVTFRVMVVEILAAIGLAMTTAGLGCAVRWLANRRRMAYWAIEWKCFGPRWSPRH
jgi:hypothetical protein